MSQSQLHKENSRSSNKVNTKYADVSSAVLDDGRLLVHLHDRARRLSRQLDEQIKRYELPGPLPAVVKSPSHASALRNYAGVPRMNIVIHIVGSRGDVQPFIPIAQCLSKPPYSHRVRLCTHPVFKTFVEENGVEFFSIGGDPSSLMAYMVKNPGLIPSMESMRAGDIGKRRQEIGEMLHQAWRSCIESGNGMQAEDKLSAGSMENSHDNERPFVADAIMANPPSFAHLHCAERLGIPLQMVFTMPWSPTQAFPHPLALIQQSVVDRGIANYVSYSMMELLSWQGLGDVINRFRSKTLKLDPISPLWGHMLLSRMRVPFIYLWSNAIIPKPLDWGPHITINGFSFLSLASSYTPPNDLMEFLNAGPPPIYIGFGSIVVDKPDDLTALIFRAIKLCNVRAIVSKGWGGFGGESAPEGVFLLGNCPHDWLFPRVSCVVHHGGAGTMAIGIALGKPTVVVPFFGDQAFWGASIFRAGAGPEPIPFKKMTDETLARSINTALSPQCQEAATKMSEQIQRENGATEAAKSFVEAIDIKSMACALCPDKVAVWLWKKHRLPLSSLATAILVDEGHARPQDLELIRHRDWYVDEGPYGPMMGLIAAISGTITSSITSFSDHARNMSKLKKGKFENEAEVLEAGDLDPYGLSSIQSHPRLQPLSAYSANVLDNIAQEIASENLSRRAGKPRRSHTSSPPRNKMHAVARECRHFAQELASTASKGPVTVFYNLANGFSNTPSYYFHDDTVRRRDNINGFRDGIRVSYKTFTYGIFDGVTGIVTQPYSGAKTEGGKGVAKGVGKGLGGLIFKPLGGVFGLIGYPLKGIEREIAKRAGRDVRARIINVRLKEGLGEFERASREEKEGVKTRWKELQISR